MVDRNEGSVIWGEMLDPVEGHESSVVECSPDTCGFQTDIGRAALAHINRDDELPVCPVVIDGGDCSFGSTVDYERTFPRLQGVTVIQ